MILFFVGPPNQGHSAEMMQTSLLGSLDIATTDPVRVLHATRWLLAIFIAICIIWYKFIIYYVIV